MNRQRLWLAVLTALTLVVVTAPQAGADENSTTINGVWPAQTNPCDGSMVPAMPGPGTITVSDSTTSTGRPVITVTTDVDVAAGEYTATMDTTAFFNHAKDQYQFVGDFYVYRNGVLEYIEWRVQETVFMSGDLPIGLFAGGARAVLCADEGPPDPPR